MSSVFIPKGKNMIMFQQKKCNKKEKPTRGKLHFGQIFILVMCYGVKKQLMKCNLIKNARYPMYDI